MSEFNVFDAVKVELKGRNLIEASAGTGKTYSIALLFLRLILKGYDITEILVVTFTNAATEEVKDRIRIFLKDAFDVLKNRPISIDEDNPIHQILKNETDNFSNSSLAVDRLENALLEFDDSAVFTIHGFCQRVIKENSFECGAVFDAELVGDTQSMIDQIARDFWREYFYTENETFLQYAVGTKNLSPEYFIKLGGKFLGQPDLMFDGEEEVDFNIVKGKIGEFKELAVKTQEEWGKKGESLKKNILDNKTILNQRSYNNNKKRKLLEYLNNPSYEMSKEVSYFTSSLIEENSKEIVSPMPLFFNLMEEMKNVGEEIGKLYRQYLVHYKRLYFSYGAEKLEELKKRSGTLSFDDLLLTVYRALASENGSKLKKVLQNKYKVVLIDEFQDTDPVQFKIFDTIFDSKNSLSFFIGDPKQAIYSFRGADIYTYLFAAEKIDSRRKYTMAKNYRSAAELVKGVNKIFVNRENPFLNEEIEMSEVSSVNDNKKDESVLTINGRTAEPMVIMFKNEDEDFNKGLLNKEKALDLFVNSTTAEISNLLDRNSKSKIGERYVIPSDIAVLTRSGSQAQAMKVSLSKAGIPVVLCNADNVFTSQEAKEFYYVLKAINAPGNKKYINAVLMTEFYGFDSKYLKALAVNEQLFDDILTEFRKLWDLASKRGFLVMFTEWMKIRKVRKKLLNLENGDRKLTNLLHIVELLNKVTLEKKLTLSALLKLFEEKIEKRDSGFAEEELMRLESDENAVQIVTIHKSKGLEYPIVFTPFLYGSSEVNKPKINHKAIEVYTYHDDEKRNIINLSEENGESDKLKEERSRASALAENIRLFYVAITRAKYRCYIHWTKISKAETSAPAYLFHGIRTSEEYKSRSVAQLYSDLQHLAAEYPFITVKKIEDVKIKKYIFEAEGAIERKAREFSGNIAKNWAVASFSSLSADSSAMMMADELKKNQREDDSSEAVPAEEIDREAKNIFNFPRGAKAGEALHAIFEEIDFTKESHQKKVIQKLKQYHYLKSEEDNKWAEVIENMVDNVLNAKLPDGFSLSEIDNNSRLTELEFYFPLQKIKQEEIKEILGKSQKHIKAAEIEGYIHGFIDLVFEKNGKFYIIDWKSNHLGYKAVDYQQEEMELAMIEHNYHLQYLFYGVALNAYLQKKIENYDYDSHFGGIYYVFLRGVEDGGNENGCGIYHVNGQELKNKVESLTKLMIG